MGGKRSNRKAAKKMGRRRRTQQKKKYNSGDFARVQYTFQNELPINATGNGSSGSPSATYGFYNFALTNSARATQVAQGFQEYRISKVEVHFKPCADTFDANVVGTGASPSIPYLYYMIDKTGSLANATTNTQVLKQAGAKPIRLDDRTIKVHWRPAVQIGSSDSAGGPAPVSELAAAYKISPWLTTNANAAEGTTWAPNSVDHMGLTFGCEQPRGPFPTTVASVSIRVTYEFRKPLWYVAPTPGVGMKKINLDDLESGVLEV